MSRKWWESAAIGLPQSWAISSIMISTIPKIVISLGYIVWRLREHLDQSGTWARVSSWTSRCRGGSGDWALGCEPAPIGRGTLRWPGSLTGESDLPMKGLPRLSHIYLLVYQRVPSKRQLLMGKWAGTWLQDLKFGGTILYFWTKAEITLEPWVAEGKTYWRKQNGYN